MPVKLSFGNIQMGVSPQTESALERPSEETPFRIIVLGDFSGKGSRGIVGPGNKLRGLRPIQVDRDNFEDVMAKLGVELHLGSGDGTRMAIRFKELDEFRPDRLVGQVEVFEKLRDTRKKLSNPATFAAAASEIGKWGSAPSAAAKETEPAKAPEATQSLSSENLLEQILGATESRREAQPAQEVDWNNFLRKVVSSYTVPREDPRQAELVSVVDSATSGLMRALLHQPEFQALEAAWRGLFFLVRRLDTDANLKLYLLDVSRAELAADLTAAEDLASSGLYKLLVEQTVGTPGAQPWAVIAGNYSFGPSAADADLLGRLGMIARRAGAPFLAAANPAVVGCPSFGDTPDPDDWKPIEGDAEEAWNAVRGLGEAAYLGLATPRFLLRLPYGKNTDAVEEFEFEEMTSPPNHEAYLWGNPAIACTYLLAETFSRKGWSMRPGMIEDIEGLPLHIFESDGESAAKPCAEAVLGSRASAAIDKVGVMPLLSVQGRDAVRLDRFRSLGSDKLAGRWQE